MDILERLIVEIINEQDYDLPVVSPILLEENSVAVMGISTNDNRLYYDGSKEQSFTFQVLVRHEVQFEAYRTLLHIANLLLNKKDVRSSHSYDFMQMRMAEEPKRLVKAEDYYIFAAQFSAEFYIRGVDIDG
ncbi:hypothetical protein [Bacillus sp. JCM 19034]|uniref:phage tail terminator protein n=1 Tax=Bacillus sp. JCM 19034 TaxID=1481928 RepID=UPI0007841ED6|nr:hypothetical protein [Bacillus sp. JCM 19034]